MCTGLAQVMFLLHRLATDDQLAVVCVLHQPELAVRHAHRLVGLRQRVRCWSGYAAASTCSTTRSSRACRQQEEKILPLLADGKANAEIAAKMFLTEKTVKNYVSSILD